MYLFFVLQVVWYRDTLRLDTTEHRITEVRGSRHTMILRKVSGSDFGNYSCVADNALGRQGKFLELSGEFFILFFNCISTRNNYAPIKYK